MKKKRTIWFGIPAYMLIQVKGMIYFFLVFSGFAVVIEIITTLNGIEHLNWILYTSALGLLFLLYMIFCCKVIFRLHRYKARFKELSGRICFRCGYEIGNDLLKCSECGSEWSLEGLGKKWKKLAEERSMD